MEKLLFIEDEQDLGNVIKQYLEISGFEVTWETNGKKAFETFSESPNYFDLVILDVNLPEMNGFELAEHIVNINDDCAFIFLTARAEKEDRIKGLKIGADDYITKPFNIDELVLRIRNIIKRNKKSPKEAVTTGNTENIINRENLVFNKTQLKLSIKGQKEVSLTVRESELLDYLFKNENKVLKREDILVALWGKNDYFLGRSLDVFVSRLRKYLAPTDYIQINNVYGMGFIFKTTKE